MGSFRFLLALAVALVHGGTVYGYQIMGGQQAVQSFYVVSGFLITFILNRKYEASLRGTWLFYSNRALRIFVPYWVILGGVFIVGLTEYGLIGLPSAARNLPGVSDEREYPGLAQFLAFLPEMSWTTLLYVIATNILIIGQDLSLWLGYRNGGLDFAFNALSEWPRVSAFNLVEPAWTLAIELMFYALAPFVVRRRLTLILSIAAACTALRVGAYAAGLQSAALLYRFFPFELGLFMAGAASFRLYEYLEGQGILTARRSLIVTGGLLALVVADVFNYPASQYRYAFYGLVVIALPFMFDFTRRVPFDQLIGELSYPLYLLHLPVQTSLHWAALQFGGAGYGARMTAISISVSIVTSIAVHVYVVVPLDKWRQHRLIPTVSDQSA